MPEITFFYRNRCTSVEQIDPQTMRSSCRLQDTQMEAFVEIIVRLPHLEIASVKGEIKYTYEKSCGKPTDFLERAVGVRIGPSMQKIIEGLLGGTTDCKQLIFMLKECCQGIILTFTKRSVQKWPKNEEQIIEHLSKDVREHIRLYNRCAAFARGSRIVEGIEPPNSDQIEPSLEEE